MSVSIAVSASVSIVVSVSICVVVFVSFSVSVIFLPHLFPKRFDHRRVELCVSTALASQGEEGAGEEQQEQAQGTHFVEACDDVPDSLGLHKHITHH